MTWEKMVSKLHKGEIDGTETRELIRQGTLRSELIGKLSDIGKDRKGSLDRNINHIWTEMLDHVYLVLGLINL